ncbi:MAG: hypothetical protein P8O00_07830, partial [Candidatus Marinimicrobia bacterium]|nr:hypothetical protein [Candidatus Neomarinimicrobiota bacterium]
TSQLNAMRLKPNPIKDMMLPRKNSKKVLFLKMLSIKNSLRALRFSLLFLKRINCDKNMP